MSVSRRTLLMVVVIFLAALALPAFAAASSTPTAAPTSVGPMPVGPMPVAPTPVAPTPVAPTPVAPTLAPDWNAPHVPGQLLIGYAPAGAAGAQAALSASGVEVVQDIPELGMALVAAPQAGSATATAEGDAAALAAGAARLTANPAIAWAEPNYLFQLDYVPNDPDFTAQQAPVLNRIQAPQAWDLTQGRPEVIIAILDTGLDMTHPDLAAGIWQNPGEAGDKAGNGIDDDGNGFIDDAHGWNFTANNGNISDDHGHGTHVAGIAAARIDNGVGIAGVAGKATIMPVDVFSGGVGTYDSLIRAIIYATDNGARVINMSLGASSYSRGEEAAVNYAWSHGVVLVAAAGNTCNGGSDSLPPCLSDHYPAAHQNVIAVAATTSDDYLASFSTRGAFVDVAAPGVSIYSTWPGGGYRRLGGTSMATPHVSGLAALILSRNPKQTPDQVRVLLESTAADLGPKGPDVYFGYGRIDAGRALNGTTADPGPYPTPAPWPRLDLDLPGCAETILDGDFEAGAGASAWVITGSAQMDTTRAYSGTQALHFLGGPDVGATVTRTLELPEWPRAALLRFAYRIEENDTGWGTNPAAPYDDRLTVEFRDATGKVLTSLLRTGNTADTAPLLPWDRYLYRLEAADLAALKAADGARLVITTQNDADSASTEVWVDNVQLCVQYWTELPHRWRFPWVRAEG